MPFSIFASLRWQIRLLALFSHYAGCHFRDDILKSQRLLSFSAAADISAGFQPATASASLKSCHSRAAIYDSAIFRLFSQPFSAAFFIFFIEFEASLSASSREFSPESFSRAGWYCQILRWRDAASRISSFHAADISVFADDGLVTLAPSSPFASRFSHLISCCWIFSYFRRRRLFSRFLRRLFSSIHLVFSSPRYSGSSLILYFLTGFQVFRIKYQAYIFADFISFFRAITRLTLSNA